MKKSLYVKRGTFLTEQGFVQAFLILFACIGIPGLLTKMSNYGLDRLLNQIFSSIITSTCFILMISAPILAFIVVIFGNLYDYYNFKKIPDGIKAISFFDEYIVLHCNNSDFNRMLNFSEIRHVEFNYKQANVFNPTAVKNSYKYGGYGMAAAMGVNTASKINYEVEIIIIDNNKQKYSMLIPAKFANNPYHEMQKVNNFFKSKYIDVLSNI